MLATDEIILKILSEAKEYDSLLQHFNIQYPNKRIAQEDNSIFVACVSSENNIEGYDFSTFTDLVEILIVTKKEDYIEAITLIKTISKHICALIMKNRDLFPNKPVIRNINPEFNRDYVLTRGHIMVQVKTEPETFELTEDEFYICDVILKDDNVS